MEMLDYPLFHGQRTFPLPCGNCDGAMGDVISDFLIIVEMEN